MLAAVCSHRAIAAVRGVDITITRGSRSVGFRAVVGNSGFEAVGGDVATVHTTTDFLVETDDWLNEFGSEPERDDWIAWGDRNFEVRSPTGEKPFRYSDTNRSILRVYTSEVS